MRFQSDIQKRYQPDCGAYTKPDMRVDTKASVSLEVGLMYCIFIHLPAGMLNSDWLTKVFTLECDNPLVITSPVSGLHQTVNHFITINIRCTKINPTHH